MRQGRTRRLVGPGGRTTGCAAIEAELSERDFGIKATAEYQSDSKLLFWLIPEVIAEFARICLLSCKALRPLSYRCGGRHWGLAKAP